MQRPARGGKRWSRTKPRVWHCYQGGGGASWASRIRDAASPHCPASQSQPRKLKTQAMSRSFSKEFSRAPRYLRGKDHKTSPRLPGRSQYVWAGDPGRGAGAALASGARTAAAGGRVATLQNMVQGPEAQLCPWLAASPWVISLIPLFLHLNFGHNNSSASHRQQPRGECSGQRPGWEDSAIIYHLC